MRRRRGVLGQSLAVDEYYGDVVFRKQLKRDSDGYYAVKPLKRNLQEIASPLNDPRPIPQIGASPDFEQYNVCDMGLAPLYVGLTNVRTSTLSAAMQSAELGINPGIGQAEIGCTFVVR